MFVLRRRSWIRGLGEELCACGLRTQWNGRLGVLHLFLGQLPSFATVKPELARCGVLVATSSVLRG